MDEKGFSYLEIIISIVAVSILMIPISDTAFRISNHRREYLRISRLENHISELTEEILYSENPEEGEFIKRIEESGEEKTLKREVILENEEELRGCISEKVSHYIIKIYMDENLLREFRIKKLI